MNNVSIYGRLTRDPELKQSQAGKSITKFSIAVNDGYGDQKKVYFFNLVSFGKTADNIAKHFTKGKEILISGKLSQSTWEKDGQKKAQLK